MRVLCIGLDGRVAAPGDAGHAVTWARQMAQLVDEYVVLAESRSGGAGSVALAENARAYRVPSSPLSFSFRAAALATRLHRETPFDVCTTEDPIRAGLAGVLFSMRTGVPLNVENHSFHLNNPDWLAERPYHRLFNRLGIWVARHANTIRNYTPDQYPVLLDVGVPRDRLFAVPCAAPETPVPPPNRRDARRALGFSDEDRVVFTAGRMIRAKNVGALLEAFAIANSHRPATLLLAGDGPELEERKAQAEHLGLNGSVRWLGAVPSDDMARLYTAADVFLTTGWGEPGPRTIWEAFAYGCPVVGTDTLGAARFDLLSHEKTGIVAAPTDVPALAKGVERLLDNPGWARELGEEGQRRSQLYTYPHLARSVLHVLEETRRIAGALVPVEQV